MAFEFWPQKLVYGGETLGYHGGHPVLVPLALPGERLEVEPIRKAKGMVHARPLQVLLPSLDRIEPPCTYFGRCGGCQYQHLNPTRQTAAKREILRETLRRIGKISWETEIPSHAAHPWNYRNQAQLKVTHPREVQTLVGFFEAESHRLVPVDACLILSPRLNAVLSELRDSSWAGHLEDCREIEMLADGRDEEVMLTLRGMMRSLSGESLAEKCLAQLPGVTSVAIEAGRGFRQFGKPALAYRVGEDEYQVSPGSFFQASRFLLSQFRTAVTSAAYPPTGRSESRATFAGGSALAVDLFAGVGLFTLPLARQFTYVIAVEGNAISAGDLAANAKLQGLSNVRVVSESVFDFSRRFAQTEPDLVVLDPPRAGVGLPALELLTSLRPRRIHYASCHPPTLARDLAFLLQRGYRVDSVEFFDFFPQTYHIESLVRLTRSS